ncbi:MAG: HPP family protein [Desulfatibacillaceae bacterium]
MQVKRVKDLMVPLAEYATVQEDENLLDAVMALEEAQNLHTRNNYMHRAVLVKDANGDVIGKLSQNDVLMGIEPGYQSSKAAEGVSHWELGSEQIKAQIKQMKEELGLWRKPLAALCNRAPRIRVKDIMYTPAGGEYVDENATLDDAIHQLVMGRHQSLLVTRGKRVVGILRLTDVFNEVLNIIKACPVP